MTYALDNPTADALQGGRPSSALRVPTLLLDADAQALVIQAAAATGRPISAAEEMGYSARSYQLTLEHDAEFNACVQAAVGRHVERLEAAADSRAVDGWLEPVFFEGEECGYIRKFDSRLLEVRLKALAPGRYRENISVESKLAAGVLVVPATAASAEAWAAAFSGATAPEGAASNIPPAAGQAPTQAAGDPRESEPPAAASGPPD